MIEKNKEMFRKLQLIQFDILKHVDKVAKEHNIQYFLGFGTLLGAIRHNGFIPWDVDIDLTLMREDYDKLVAILKAQNDTSDYYISVPGDKNHTSPHALIYCKNTVFRDEFSSLNKKSKRPKEVFIDIFPIDKLPMDEKQRKAQIKRIVKLRKRVYLKTPFYFRANKLYRFLKKLRTFLYVFESNAKIQRKIDKEMRKYNNTDSNEYGQFGSSHLRFFVLNKEDYFPVKEKKFEDFVCPIPNNYDKFLKMVYKDYMKMPSKEKIEQFFDKDIMVIDNRK